MEACTEDEESAYLPHKPPTQVSFLPIREDLGYHCPSPIPQVVLHLDQFKQAQKRAEELMIKAQKSWVRNKDMLKYKVGDQV